MHPGPFYLPTVVPSRKFPGTRVMTRMPPIHPAAFPSMVESRPPSSSSGSLHWTAITSRHEGMWLIPAIPCIFLVLAFSSWSELPAAVFASPRVPPGISEPERLRRGVTRRRTVRIWIAGCDHGL